jgi:hypothetical protein
MCLDVSLRGQVIRAARIEADWTREYNCRRLNREGLDPKESERSIVSSHLDRT